MIIEQWLLGGGAAAALGLLLWTIGRGTMARIKDLEQANAEKNGRLLELESEHREIREDIRGHIEREEGMLWPKVDDLTNRLIRIEASLPNGELRTLLFRFSTLEKMLETAVGDVKTAVAEVRNEQRAHEAGAQDWKERIVRLEDKLP
jgi:hypothetical protein